MPIVRASEWYIPGQAVAIAVSLDRTHYDRHYPQLIYSRQPTGSSLVFEDAYPCGDRSARRHDQQDTLRWGEQSNP